MYTYFTNYVPKTRPFRSPSMPLMTSRATKQIALIKNNITPTIVAAAKDIFASRRLLKLVK